MFQDKSARKVYLNENTLKILDEYKNEHGVSRSSAIDKIVREHKELKTRLDKNVIDKMADAIYERFNNDLVRIRLGANAADKNTQILLEMLNLSMLHQQAHTKFKPTEVLDTPVYVEATEHVTNRIAKYKQRKDSKNT